MSDHIRILGGRYELVAPAGVGGMATVWRGQLVGADLQEDDHDTFQRTVAIKRLHGWVAGQEHGVAAFLEEACLVSELSHPHIVQVIDFQQDPDDGRYVLVLEWVDGLDLGRYFRACAEQKEPAPWPVLTGIVIEVLRALEAAHCRRDREGNAAPIFHRDISPSNVLVGVNGVTKLADFGMARALDRVTQTQPGLLKGKLAYMAPDYLVGGQATVETEIYAVGVMLWEGLAGRRLRNTADPDQLVAQSGEGVPNVSALRPSLPEALVAIVERAVAKAPEDRFGSARAMHQALRALVMAEGVDTSWQTIGAAIENAQALGAFSPGDEIEESGEWPLSGFRPPQGPS